MPLVFINYRRSDSQPAAFNLRNELRWRFGNESVFIDIGDIPPGTPWPDRIRQQLEHASVFLLVVGPGWLTAADKYGRRRLDQKDDWVRKEIEYAIERAGSQERKLTIIPVTVAGQREPPPEDALPPELAPFVNFERLCLGDESWDRDVRVLIDLLIEQHQFVELEMSRGRAACNPLKYLSDLAEETAYIDIRGIQIGQEHVHRFPIEELFISLTTSARLDERRFDVKAMQEPEGGTIRLEEALGQERLIVIGDPGSGKTTFLRRVANALCRHELDGPALSAAEPAESVESSSTSGGFFGRLAKFLFAGDSERTGTQPAGDHASTFPVFIRISELAQHLLRHENDRDAPTGESAAWLCHYQAAAAADNNCGLDREFFTRTLEAGRGTLLFDGLDETPDRIVRERIARLIENVAKSYGKCRFVVTSRPDAYADRAVLGGFHQAVIDPLSDQAVEIFLSKWCIAVYVESPRAADEHKQELLAALRARPEIRRMARTPVMLTVVAVVHYHERRLPEQRAELYEWVLRWLAGARDQKPNRESRERTLQLLRELALAMQIDPAGYQKQVCPRRAGEMLAREFTQGTVDHQAIDRAEAFVESATLDTGIIVKRAGQVQFWHRTFQEYLAARAVAARVEAGQEELLWGPAQRVYIPEWGEVMPLLAGVLHQQGKEKVDRLVSSLLSRLGAQATLAEEARCAGLLGVMLRDLAPVKYTPPGREYDDLLQRVAAIFDRDRSASVPINTRIEAADALGQAGDARLDFHRADYWVTIPAGKFLMGTQTSDRNQPNYDDEAYSDESPVHEVELRVYQIGRYPVTVGQYQQFVEDEGYADRRWWSAGGFEEYGTCPADWDSQVEYPSRPVVSVSWHEAMAFCAWSGFRLPTEAEWERAARGTEGRKFPWGNEAVDETRASFAGNVGHATPVGIYPLGTTPDGICDLAGNVWEWCHDPYGEYGDAKSSAAHPRAPAAGSSRVLRGGSWSGIAVSCRSASRDHYAPQNRSSIIGFRVCRVSGPA
ncbi:MAG: SUMF1/EgtB/PvdO family nonheme iron enzyme [Planctomycetales bacterium]